MRKDKKKNRVLFGPGSNTRLRAITTKIFGEGSLNDEDRERSFGGRGGVKLKLLPRKSAYTSKENKI